MANRVLGQFHQPLVQCPFKAVILGNGAPDLDILVGLDRGRQHGRQVQTVGFPVVDRVAGLQHIHATDHVVHAAEAQLRHPFPGLLGHQEQVVDDVLGRTGELLAQHRVLGRDPHRTGVEMTLAHHDAAQGDQRTRGEAHLLGPEQRGDHHVPPGLQSTVGLQNDAAAQVVHHQGLMRFGNAQFPRQAGMLDAGERRSARAAGIAGDQDMIGVRLGHARGNGAHTHLRHQLDADARIGVRILQIVNELGEILDGVDVMVRRRTDEPHPRRGVADPRDGLVHLASREFAALPGLGALGHLDLQLVGVGQVPDGDAETAGGHLLDGRAPGIAGWQRPVPLGVLPALAGIAAAADAIHRHRQ